MILFINAVEPVLFELNLCCTVTIDTPAHAEVCKLFHLVHFLDLSMAGMALYFFRFNVLCMAEENMVRKVMDLGPLNRFCFSRVHTPGVRIFTWLKAYSLVYLLNFISSVHFRSVFTV